MPKVLDKVEDKFLVLVEYLLLSNVKKRPLLTFKNCTLAEKLVAQIAEFVQKAAVHKPSQFFPDSGKT